MWKAPVRMVPPPSPHTRPLGREGRSKMATPMEEKLRKLRRVGSNRGQIGGGGYRKLRGTPLSSRYDTFKGKFEPRPGAWPPRVYFRWQAGLVITPQRSSLLRRDSQLSSRLAGVGTANSIHPTERVRATGPPWWPKGHPWCTPHTECQDAPSCTPTRKPASSAPSRLVCR